jgi:hypothetical protein
MRRYHQERALIRRHHREYLQGMHATFHGPDDSTDLEAGHFRKRRAQGFGLEHRVHHFDKVTGVPPRQEQLAEHALREELRELWEDLVARSRH